MQASSESDLLHESVPADHIVAARFAPRYVAALIASVPIFSSVYFFIGTRFFASRLSFSEYLAFCTTLAAAIVGLYQLYFWMQRHNRLFARRDLTTPLDELIPFYPSWVWIYAFIYYALVGFAVTSISSLHQGLNYISGGVVLLLMHGICAMLLPSTVPPHWRVYKVDCLSTKFLRFIQRIDGGQNCWPSMHCALAMYVCSLMYGVVGPYVYALAGLVAISCLLVKQHQLADVVPGLVLGWVASILAQHL